VNTRNGLVVIPKIAGIESSAKMRSMVPSDTRTRMAGVRNFTIDHRAPAIVVAPLGVNSKDLFEPRNDKIVPRRTVFVFLTQLLNGNVHEVCAEYVEQPRIALRSERRGQ